MENLQTTKETVPTVPAKISDLIQLALDDVDKCEKDGRYVIDMDNWHQPGVKKCHVCLAGAVMAQTLKCDINKQVQRSLLSVEWNSAMIALDKVREGYLIFTYIRFFRNLKLYPYGWPLCVEGYLTNTWRENAEKVRDFFKEKGL